MGTEQNQKPNAAKAGDKIKLHYECKLDDGTLFATSHGRDPIEFVLGTTQIIPGIQEAVLGMQPGERKTVTIPPEKAYGPYFEEMTATIDRSLVPEGLPLEIGLAIRLQHADGAESNAFVTAINEDTISVDGNHPLAGKNLTMDLELVEVSAA